MRNQSAKPVRSARSPRKTFNQDRGDPEPRIADALNDADAISDVKPKLTFSLQCAIAARDLPARTQFRQWATAALRRDAEITLRIVDENEGRALNRDYRGRDYPTNVLTFVYSERPLQGDIAICAPVVACEAAERNIGLHAHYAHLVVHAVLHLQGHDHENDDEATAMEALETATLESLGFADPYASDWAQTA